MADEGIDSRLERAIDEFRQYLSDLVPPMIVADSMELLLKCPPELVASNIYSWVASQNRSSRAIPLSDYFFHAVKKIHLMAEYKLIPAEELSAFLNQLKPLVLQYCPTSDRENLRRSLDRLNEIPASLSATVGVVYRQSAGEGPQLESSPMDSVQTAEVLRLNLLMQRLEKQIGPVSKSGKSPESEEIVADALAEAAISARKSVELENSLEYLRKLGVNATMEDVFRALGRNITEWQLPSKPDLAVPEDSNIKAMHRIVAQAKDSKEGAVRFHHMVRAAIERFNEGHLQQASSMIDLAERIITAKEVEESVSQNLRKWGHEGLDTEKIIRKYMENPEQHHLLRKVMNFFEALRPPGLLDLLNGEPKRDRRKLLLALLEIYGEPARPACIEFLRVPPGPNTPEVEIFFRRNLIYLLRRIPAEATEPQEELVEIAARHASLIFLTMLVKESVMYLGQLKHEKSEKALTGLMNEIESILLAPTEPPYDVSELQQLLDRIAASLARLGTFSARKALLEHGFKKKPKLGDTMRRLSEFSAQDLSGDQGTIERLLTALKANVPKKLLGLVVQQRDQDLKSIVEALSGTPLPRVRQALDEVAKQFPDSPGGIAAAKALKTPPQPNAHAFSAPSFTSPILPPKRSPEPPSTSLTGDLDLFALPALIQSLSDNLLTGTLVLKDPKNEVFATIVMGKGRLQSCKTRTLTAEPAFFQLLERTQPGTFQFTRAPETPQDLQSTKEFLPLIMEGIRRYDELLQLNAILPDTVRLKAKSAQPTKLDVEKDGMLFRELWNAVRSGATPVECEAIVPVDSYRVRRLLAHWVETGAVEVKS